MSEQSSANLRRPSIAGVCALFVEKRSRSELSEVCARLAGRVSAKATALTVCELTRISGGAVWRVS
jgi:hypothetical protein